MPKTKQRRRRTTRVAGETGEGLSEAAKRSIIEAIHVYVNRARENLIATRDDCLQEMKLRYEALLTACAPDLDKTIQQLREENQNPKINDGSLSLSSVRSTNCSASSRDEDGSSTYKGLRRSKRESRSLTRNIRLGQSKTPVASSARQGRKKRSSSVGTSMGPPRVPRPPRYRTPANPRSVQQQYPAITPKMAPNTPMAVIRQPRQGEMVVSLSGSPLLVHSTAGASGQANCNIPLSDGTIISLLPNKLGGSTAGLPFDHMQPHTKKELKLLQENLSKYLKNLKN